MKSILIILLFSIFIVTIVHAQSRTPWEMNLGGGIISFDPQIPTPTPYHGYELEYDFASIPAPNDVGWGPAPDPDIIAYSQIPSTLCDVMDCRCGGDFTYFRTFVNIPWNVAVTEFTIATSGVDDGVRVTIFNSVYPGGLVIPGSYIFLGGSGTANLKDYVVSGEINTVIITHVDDCCYHSYLSSANIVLNGEIVVTTQLVDLDIHPTSCPNPLNTGSKGVVPVAILGTAELDVTTIDPATITLEGVSPLRWSIEDVATPLVDGEECDCNTAGPDGFDDLTLKFKTQELVNAIGSVNDRDVISLTLLGNLKEEFAPIPIEGTDCVIVLAKELNIGIANNLATPNEYSLVTHPNPFNPSTLIQYTIPEANNAKLSIYNAIGQLVATLIDGYHSAGTYNIKWQPESMPSGTYLIVFQSDNIRQTAKLMYMR